MNIAGDRVDLNFQIGPAHRSHAGGRFHVRLPAVQDDEDPSQFQFDLCIKTAIGFLVRDQGKDRGRRHAHDRARRKIEAHAPVIAGLDLPVHVQDRPGVHLRKGGFFRLFHFHQARELAQRRGKRRCFFIGLAARKRQGEGKQ